MENFDPRIEYNKISDTQVKYTGPTRGGISTGESLSKLAQLLLNTIEKLDSLTARVHSLEQEGGLFNSGNILSNSELYDLVDQSLAVENHLTNKPITLGVSPNTNGQVDLNFDFMDAVGALDSKYVPVGIDTSVRTLRSNKLLGSSAAKKGTLTVSNTTEPLLVTSKINLKTPDGDVVLSKTFYIPTNQPAELTGKFQSAGVVNATVKDMTQKDYNEVLASNVSRLQKALDNLDSKIVSLESRL